MGFKDWLLGRETPAPAQTRDAAPAYGVAPAPAGSAAPAAPTATQTADPDQLALERYRYLLRTASPDTIEQVHTEAFAKLTDAQRDQLFEELKTGAPAGEAPADASPQTLARAATRSELRQPGTLERSMSGGGGAGMGFGASVASSLLGTVAGFVIGSALVSALFPADTGSEQAADSGTEGDSSADAGATDSASADAGAADAGAADTGFDGGGDFGGDFGGFGDFGF